ncbi:hypothetical protein D8674_008215 [Pyrus ussuriensis x Pyrus communis]|uniref:Uncharacterized protein n=1 Tax=Pyrus ussuriensis x Pyrus communis TaxID=2448454 RepID=A0A5N5HS59_9ROSA|nr:hypothetical protein D8674_008215 [Pyrus ussuriensis x Pyrus communis]
MTTPITAATASTEIDHRPGSKFPEIDVFADVYVRPGNELIKSLHATMVEKSQLVLQESASQLPSDTPIESMDPLEDSKNQVTALTQEVAGLRSELASYNYLESRERRSQESREF